MKNIRDKTNGVRGKFIQTILNESTDKIKNKLTYIAKDKLKQYIVQFIFIKVTYAEKNDK